MTESPFSRSELMLGEKASCALSSAQILIVGTGGVGGWCAEALVRTGARRIALVDSDRVAPSNINRQVMARPATLGRPKVEALREHLLAISQEAEVEAHFARYEPDTVLAGAFDFSRYDFVIDAIDSVPSKCALVRNALAEPRVALFSSLGAALKFDPTRVRCSEFGKVAGDALARAMRARFRRDGSWPSRKFSCVWSDEPPHEAARADGCNGSLMQVTAAFGLALASLVVDSVAEGA